MTTLIVLFWLFLALSLHPYLSYPALVWLGARLHPFRPRWAPITPKVSVLIPAYNEERLIAKRVANLLALDWPRAALEIIVASDGSDDRTNQIVLQLAEEHPQVRLLALERGGRCAAINQGVAAATGAVVMLSDAATHFDPDVLRQAIGYFADARVDCVVGTIRMLPADGSSLRLSEGAYWRFEGMLRGLESRAGLTFIGAGACTAIRRERFPRLDADASDDLTAVIRILLQGGRAIQLDTLGVYDYMDGDARGQIRARSRRVVRSLTTVAHNLRIINPCAHPRHAFAVISHKVLRWLSPWWALGMLITSGLLYDLPLYRGLFAAQLLFYLLALIGLALQGRRSRAMKVISIPTAVLVMLVAFAIGSLRWALGERLQVHQPLQVSKSPAEPVVK